MKKKVIAIISILILACVTILKLNRKVLLKNVVYPQKGDKIVYNIRVYNEGTIAGTANKITEYLPEGLDFNGNSAINIKYGWKVSEDGRSVTTEFLKPLSINPYTEYMV